MGLFSSSPPSLPNPYAVASAAQVANIETAIANIVMNNPNQDRPEASTATVKTGDYLLAIPIRDTSGNVTGTFNYNVPTFKTTVTLKSGEQGIYDKNTILRGDMLDLGIAQMTHVQTKLGTPVTFAGLSPYATTPTPPTLNTAVSTPGALVASIDPGDLTTDLSNTRDAIDARLQFQIEFDRANRRIDLTNMGLTADMDSWSFEMLAFSKESTDARQQAWLAAQKEQTRATEIRSTIAAFANTAQAQMFQQGVTIRDFANNTLIRAHQIAVNLAAFINSVREAKRNELLLERAQDLNELQTMIHGGPVSIPQFQPFQPGNVDATPLASSVYASAGLAQQQYQNQMSQQNDLWGGVLGALGTIAGGPIGGAAARSLFG